MPEVPMEPHTRALIAAAAFALISGKKVAGMHDHSSGKDLRIAAEGRGGQLQGYDGDSLVLRRSVLKMRMADDCGGTAPFFYPAGQGNTSVDIDGLVVAGGGYPFRLGTPGSVRGLHVVQDSWVFGPIDVNCDALSTWQADISVLKGGQPRSVRPQRCTTDAGY